MEDKILVNLSTDANHTFECETNIIGREGEGNTSRFEITVPEKLKGCSVYLDFEKPNGEKLRTPELKMENGVAVYDVVAYILADDGEVKVQAVLQTSNGQIWKSSIKSYFNQNSINALEETPQKEDFLTEIQRVLDEISKYVIVVDSSLDKTSSNPVQNKAVAIALDDKVPKSTTVNGKPLSGNVTIGKSDVGLANVDNVKQYSTSNPPPYPVASVAGKTGAVTLAKSDVGLGSVVNTGDSATPVSGGTTKFTTGGAYTELAKKADKTTVSSMETRLKAVEDTIKNFTNASEVAL